MKFSSLLPLLICPAFSKAAYVPFGTVLGDFTAAESFPPKVVLNYLTACSGSITNDPDGCLVSNFAELRVPSDYEDATVNQSAPGVAASEITASASVAKASCNGATDEQANTLAVQYQAAIDFNGGSCWASLFDSEAQVPILIEAKWVKNCADTTLPYPITAEEYSTFSQDTIQHRSVLTCMLDLAFEVPASAFGLENPATGSPETCYPTGFAEISTFCPSTLGPQILQFCLDAKEEYNDDAAMSMDYSDPNSGNNSTDPVALVEEFCEIMADLSSDVGRGCMLDVCEFNATEAPSGAPSNSPSLVASTAPSITVSTLPSSSSVPSSVPSSTPSVSTFPTSMPSSLPSFSSAPSVAASSIPSFSLNPSATPSSQPSSSSAPSSIPSSTPSSSVNPSASPSDAPSVSQAPSVMASAAPSDSPVPSAMPTSAPTRVASSNPSVSTNPSSSPSVTKSSAPSVTESSLPSNLPSLSPSITLPSAGPSMSQSPSFGKVQAHVDIEVFSTVTLNMAPEDVPSDSADFLDVIAMAISDLVAPSEVMVRLPEEKLLHRIRRLVLTGELDLSVQVKATRSCFIENCNDYGILAAGKIEQEVQIAAATGILTDNIQEIATTKNVMILQSVVVNKFLVVNNTISVEEVEDDDDTDDSTSSAPFHAAHWCGIATALAGIMLI